MTTAVSSVACAASALQDMATVVLDRLATYTMVNLIDDAAMLSLLFI
jgi:hypothetical protein